MECLLRDNKSQHKSETDISAYVAGANVLQVSDVSRIIELYHARKRVILRLKNSEGRQAINYGIYLLDEVLSKYGEG